MDVAFWTRTAMLKGTCFKAYFLHYTPLYKKKREIATFEHRDAMTSLNLDFSVLDRPVRKEADELTST